MEFFILGPVRASVNGVNVPLGGAKQRTVLASLLLCGNGVLSDDRLTRLLWDASPPTTASAQIHTYMSRLRTRLSPHIEIQRRHQGYAFQTYNAWIDHNEFEALIEDAQFELSRGQYQTAAGRLRRALALWRGPALSDVTSFLGYAAGPALEEARMAALEARIEADLRLGRHTNLVPELTGLVGEFPFRERLRAQLMTALYYCDRQADALAVYESGRRSLADELGIDPGDTLTRTQLAVLTGDFSSAPFAVPAVPGVQGAPGVQPCRESIPAMNRDRGLRVAGRDARILADIKPESDRNPRPSRAIRLRRPTGHQPDGVRYGHVDMLQYHDARLGLDTSG